MHIVGGLDGDVGTGKSFVFRKEAEEVVGTRDQGRSRMI